MRGKKIHVKKFAGLSLDRGQFIEALTQTFLSLTFGARNIASH